MSEQFPFDHFFQKSNNTSNIGPLSNNIPAQIEDNESDQTEIKTLNCELFKLVKGKISESKFNAYFNGTLRLSKIGSNTINLTASTEFIKTIIEANYLDLIKESLVQLLGKKYEIHITASPNEHHEDSHFSGGNSSSDKRSRNARDASFTLDLNPREDDIISSIESKYIEHVDREPSSIIIDTTKTFENFIIGPSNNMAHATAVAVAKNPGKTGKYPCLYIYSDSGLGKTHLLHAVANGIADGNPELRICLITARDFMNELINSMSINAINEFRKKYSEKVDVLMIDDIHELKGKQSTQNEFFHVFNELHGKGKQLIFTSDKQPREIVGIEERIKTRLSWGLVIDIQRPDIETRIAILKKKAQDLDLFISNDIISLIAGSVKSSIRELEGSLIKLSAYVDVVKVEVDEDIVRELLQLDGLGERKDLSLEVIAKATANYFKIPLADIKSKARNKDVTKARHIAMYLSRKLFDATQQEIGLYFGGRDHTSVIHGVSKIGLSIKTDLILAKDVLQIENSF